MSDQSVDCANHISQTPERAYWPTEGWREADPAAVGLDADRLQAADAYLREHVPHIDSVLVVRGGQIAFERYTRGDRDSLRNAKSATKSVLSALIGIALDTGDIAGLETPLSDHLMLHLASVEDRAKRDITVGDLLTMRSGLAWAEWGPNVTEMTVSPDWIAYVLDRQLAHTPGSTFNYSTGDTQLLSGLLYRAAGMVASDFADLYLFGPLGIRQREWPADPQGYTIGGAELALTTRDLAKIGYLYLNGGFWEGRQVVPYQWVLDSTRTQVAVHPADGQHPPVCYGYLWWLRPQAAHSSFMAVGYGGQYIYGVPDLDLLVILTGDLRHIPRAFTDNRMIRDFDVVAERIIPAVIA